MNAADVLSTITATQPSSKDSMLRSKKEGDRRNVAHLALRVDLKSRAPTLHLNPLRLG